MTTYVIQIGLLCSLQNMPVKTKVPAMDEWLRQGNGVAHGTARLIEQGLMSHQTHYRSYRHCQI